MHKSFLLLLLTLFSITTKGQEITPSLKQSNKGKLFFYWGWNRDNFSKSNIHFTGDNYDFTLKKVVAHDKPSEYKGTKYLDPLDATIPQYNYRVGYHFSDKYSLSFGFDHMKYVVTQDQIATIDGTINNSGTAYDGVYSNEPIALSKNFLELEHTDGLNYLNFELRRHHEVWRYKKIGLEILGGIGAGMMVPRTDATLLGQRRHDEFHIAGYGLDALVGAKIQLGKTLFIQSEYKLGYINMPDIRTTYSPADNASQSFFFNQYNFVFGAEIGLFHVK